VVRERAFIGPTEAIAAAAAVLGLVALSVSILAWRASRRP
jgi:hypothetical protein